MLYSTRYTQPTRASFGSLDQLINEELTSIVDNSYHIAVVGPNGSGKVGLTRTLAERAGYNYMLSDDFIEGLDPSVHSYDPRSPLQIQPQQRSDAKKAMYNMLDMVMEHRSPLMYVGSMVPRLLRAGLRDQFYVPDTVIFVECNDQTLKQGHINRGHFHKLEYNLSAHKGNLKILNEWNSMLNADMLVDYPTIVRIDTSVF